MTGTRAQRCGERSSGTAAHVVYMWQADGQTEGQTDRQTGRGRWTEAETRHVLTTMRYYTSAGDARLDARTSPPLPRTADSRACSVHGSV